MTSIVKNIRKTLFGKKRPMTWVFWLALVLILGYIIWVLYKSIRSYEGFGSDGKLSLSYKYVNKTNEASLNVHAITDTIINSSSYSAYTPQTMPYSSNPSFVTANIIDMSSSDNLWLIIQANKSGDYLPKKFDFSVRLDLSLNSGYYINFAVPKKAAITPNKVTIGDNKNIGTINLGRNSIHVLGEGEVRDINNALYGVVTKTMDNREHPSYVIFDCSFSNVVIDTTSLVIEFGKLSHKKGKGGKEGGHKEEGHKEEGHKEEGHKEGGHKEEGHKEKEDKK